MGNFFKQLTQMFSPPKTTLKKDCRYCGGGRCMGMCGGSLAKLEKIKLHGLVSLNAEEQGVIEAEGGAFTFDPASHFGKMILKACPEGSQCNLEVLAKEQHIEKLISAKRVKEK